MGRKSITGGVTPKGRHRIQFNFRIEGVRYRPSLRWVPSGANLRRARDYLRRIKAQIEAGTFRFSEEFPDYPIGKTGHLPLNAQTCSDVFDAFLRHEAARVARGDLAPITLASHRQILDHVWRPHVGPLPFLGIRHSMLVKIADASPGIKKPTTTPSVPSVERLISGIAIIPSSAIRRPCCAARASARKTVHRLTPSVFRTRRC
jgi:Arm domain-containing DNA-binding protein